MRVAFESTSLHNGSVQILNLLYLVKQMLIITLALDLQLTILQIIKFLSRFVNTIPLDLQKTFFLRLLVRIITIIYNILAYLRHFVAMPPTTKTISRLITLSLGLITVPLLTQMHNSTNAVSRTLEMISWAHGKITCSFIVFLCSSRDERQFGFVRTGVILRWARRLTVIEASSFQEFSIFMLTDFRIHIEVLRLIKSASSPFVQIETRGLETFGIIVHSFLLACLYCFH